MEGGAGIIVTAEEQTQLASPERVLVRGSGACALVAGVRACAMGLSWKPGEDEVKASVGSDWGELQGHRLLNQGPSLQEAGKFSPQQLARQTSASPTTGREGSTLARAACPGVGAGYDAPGKTKTMAVVHDLFDPQKK